MAETVDIGLAWSGNAPATGPYTTGTPPYANVLTLADTYLLEVLYGAFPFSVFAVQDSTASTTYTAHIQAPPYATKCQIGVIAAGTGTVQFAGSYDITIAGDASATTIGDAGLVWGPDGTGLLAVSSTTTGLPATQSISVASPADVVIYSIVFVWTRVTTAL